MVSLLLSCSIFLQGQTLPLRPATALNKVILYSDSSFFVHSNTFYEEGTLFEVIGETAYEYEDDAQNQKFKWYQVNAADGKIGWIYGDGLAVIIPKSETPPLLKPYYLETLDFSGDLGKATVWVASIEGKDNFHKEDYLNPLYKEFYLVITSQLGKSIPIQYAGMSAMGSDELGHFAVRDITGDNIPEIILLKNSFTTGSNLENRNLEIYSFQAGSVVKVFEERMSLAYEQKTPSPALFKFIELDKKSIRVAYVDYLNCDQYSLALPTDIQEKVSEKCLEYVTYSYNWNEQSKKYLPIYEESRTYVEGFLKEEKGYLRAEPSFLSEVVAKLTHKAPLKIIKHHEKVIFKAGKKSIVPYLYVQAANGKCGYIHANNIEFQNIEHAFILNRYYENPPPLKADWKSDSNFFSLKINEKRLIVTDNY